MVLPKLRAATFTGYLSCAIGASGLLQLHPSAPLSTQRDIRINLSSGTMPPRKKKQTQARLTFEPVGANTESSTSAYSPARVRYAKASHSSPAARSSPMAASPSLTGNSRRSSKRKQKQGTIDSMPPPPSFMPRQTGRPSTTLTDDSDDSAAEIGDAGYDEDDVDLLPPTQKARKPQDTNTSGSEDSDEDVIIVNPRSSQSVFTRLQRTVIVDSSDEEDSKPSRLSSPLKRRRPSVSRADDSDDVPISLSKPKKKLAAQALVELDDSDEEIISPLKKRKISPRSSPLVSNTNRTPGKLKRLGAAASSPIKKPHKGHRSEKEKKMELLRRRRAGEKITQLTSSESSSGEDEKRGIYDSDSEGNFEVLKEFDDEEEEEEVEAEEKPAPRKLKPKRKREKSTEKTTDKEDNESDLEDFVIDDDDAPLGAPVDIPLEFTSHAHKPLKEQFPHVIEWLVHNRINPAFDRQDPIYVNAWRKLNDEATARDLSARSNGLRLV
ncbi:hypothetical protein NPX13_g4949 [Xylaria arbuscula]|uniref:DUF4211 domain-containing protein n=1 Tax=Xylaria arbuscula TaxID=114810 RepID=A0A9W8TN52_9PEZI|nr:hypothetical protein NPX13_g4949 [Xylaria arbuscula]